MRISELARRGEVPVGTVKFYLREGLLPAGRSTSATQASYDEQHVARLTLIRVLTGIGGLSLAVTRDVLAAIDAPPKSLHDLLGAAHSALGGELSASEDARERARGLVDRLGWQVSDQALALGQLAAGIDGLAAAGFPATDDELTRYAAAAGEIARGDVAGVPTGPAQEVIRYVVTKTVLAEPILLALRRLAQEDVSARGVGG